VLIANLETNIYQRDTVLGTGFLAKAGSLFLVYMSVGVLMIYVSRIVDIYFSKYKRIFIKYRLYVKVHNKQLALARAKD
jgi:hypothetical protein